MRQTKSEEHRSLIERAVHLILLPIRLALSPLARRAYLSTILLFITSIALLLLSSIAYLLFYHAYVPHAAVSVPIYLQYAHPPSSPNCPPPSGPSSSALQPSLHPFGTALLLPALSSHQPYDVSLVLKMPRSPTNLRAGNFMVDLAMLSPKNSAVSPSGTSDPATDPEVIAEQVRAMSQQSSGAYGEGIPETLSTPSENIVARARRPALMPFASREVDLLHKIVSAPWYAIGWKQESERVEVGMLEEVEFSVPRTRNLRGAVGIPDRVRVLLESREVLEVYSATVEVRARLKGLRWVMYRHRIASFVVFTGMFWAVMMGTTVAVYGGMMVWQVMKENEEHDQPERKGARKQIKDEPEDEDTDALSDTSRTFPSRPGQEPLRYTGRGRRYEDEDTIVKKEESDEAVLNMANIPPLEADDEDNADEYDDGDSFRDSGIGTSREERDRTTARRRKRLSGVALQGAGGWDGHGRAPGL